MSRDLSIPGTNISVSAYRDGIWNLDQLIARPVPLSPLASVTYNSGKEIRVYYLDPSSIIQECCYSEGRGWYQGGVCELGAKANPAADLAAVAYDNGLGGVHLRIYYQEAGTHAIAELCYNDRWCNGELRFLGSVCGTSLAAVAFVPEGLVRLRVYYQAQDLSLRECCYNLVSPGWFIGDFNPGHASGRTPIGAIAFGNVQLQVYWRDISGRVVFSRYTGSWGAATVIEGLGPSFRFAVVQWGEGMHLRLCYQDFGGFLAEYRSDDSGNTWSPGTAVFWHY